MANSKNLGKQGGRVFVLLGLVVISLYTYFNSVPPTSLTPEAERAGNAAVPSVSDVNILERSDSAYDLVSTNSSLLLDNLVSRNAEKPEVEKLWEICKCKGIGLLHRLGENVADPPTRWTQYSDLVDYGWSDVSSQKFQAGDYLIYALFTSVSQGGLGASRDSGVEVTWSHLDNSKMTYSGPGGKALHYKVMYRLGVESIFGKGN